MARVILKSPYIKGGKKNQSAIKNMVKYISTRDGVEKISSKNTLQSATKKQMKLIEELKKDFPMVMDLKEYAKFLETGNRADASGFLARALEECCVDEKNLDIYMNYIANRPRAEKINTHGLFSSGTEELNLAEVSEELAKHKGNVWLPIISLTREDAVNTEFDSAESWKNLISGMEHEIADAMKIKHENFRWVGAFHDEGHHPHVHLMCYSTDPKEGYLSKRGIEKMRSSLTKNIFAHELEFLYAEQTKRRDYVRKHGKDVLKKLIGEMQATSVESQTFDALFQKLAEELKTVEGKKTYAFLKPELKNIVDALVDELEKEKSVGEAYALWHEMRDKVIRNYRDEGEEYVPLSQREEFKPLRNAVIHEAIQFVIQENQAVHDKQVAEKSISFHKDELLKHLGRIFEEMPLEHSPKQRMDSKLLREMRQKKLALGQKSDGQKM
ncbi:MAG: MobP3 family relaxase [Bacillota bacterium]